MELRVLRYFLAVCEAGTMSRAAAELHVTQPALSRQIAQLERELGCTLLERRSRAVVPTEEGLYLRRRAEEIIALADQTEADLTRDDTIVAGDIHIGAGESDSMRVVAHHIKTFRDRYPDVRFHLHSGNATDVAERLERGLDDFAVFLSYAEVERFAHLRLKVTDAWGVLMRADDPLAEHELVSPADLLDAPVIMPTRYLKDGEPTGAIASWLGEYADDLEVAATINLLLNGVHLVREGMGRALSVNGEALANGSSDLACRLLFPPLVSTVDIAWKRGQAHTNAVRLFLEHLRDVETPEV